MIFKRYNSKVPLAFESAFLFLAICVFTWGLQAKLSGYGGDSQASAATSSTAKLSIEENSSRVVASVKDQQLPILPLESLHFAVLSLTQQGKPVTSVCLSQLRASLRVPIQYSRHCPGLMRRPPPTFS